MNTIDDLIARLKANSVRLSVRDGQLIYSAKPGVLTPGDLAHLKAHKPTLIKMLGGSVAGTLSRQPRTGRLPLSHAQERLWFLEQVRLADLVYNVPIVVRMAGALELHVLERSFAALVDRHESLRTRFVEFDGAPAQVIDAPGAFKLDVTDLSFLPSEKRDAAAERMVEQQLHRAFDLLRGPVFRARLFRLHDESHVLMVTMHHIVSDGWSMHLLHRDLLALYHGFLNGIDEPLPPLSVQYVDYAIWQRDRMQEAAFAEHMSYWKRQLSGAPPLLTLPTARVRPAVATFEGAAAKFSISPDVTRVLAELAHRHEATLFMVLLAAFHAVLSKWSGQRDVVVGVPVAGRTHWQTQEMIGLFVNMLPVRVQTEDELLFTELLVRVKRAMLEGFEHQELPFQTVVAQLHPQRDLSRHPVFQVCFQLLNLVPQQAIDTELKWDAVELSQAVRSRFDLELHMSEAGGGLSGAFVYATDLFDAQDVARWIEHFQVFLEGVAQGAERSISALPILTIAERARLIEAFNATAVDYPREQLVHEIFEQRAQSHPYSVAVVSEGRHLSYGELNAAAERLAHSLMESGARSGQCVAIVLPRSAELIVAQLAVLKCGCAYVPIDPELPRTRQEFIAGDCRARLIIAPQMLRLMDPPADVQWIDPDQRASESPRAAHESTAAAHPLSAAYVMYTSGSTGVPKGVVVPHQAVLRLVINNDYVTLESSDCIAYCSNPAFDPSTFEIWGALLNGARILVISPTMLLDPVSLVAELEKQDVTILHFTTGLFNQYADVLGPFYRKLKCLLFGGEAADAHITRGVLQRWEPRSLVHLYGPTETTAFATSYRVQSILEGQSTIPIGHPIANTQVYILDRSMQPVPIGVTGELHVGGPGVALGYLNRPDLTAERFCADPFSQHSGARLYRTGDLARFQADGTIQYLGRADRQVKLRGYRIELGEIEAALLSHPSVKQAAVLAREDAPGDKRLVAYVCLANEVQLSPATPQSRVDVSQLRALLQTCVPEYMIPSAFVVLEQLPLTANGKLDRDALPAPDMGLFRSEYNPPHGDVETAVAELWEELLHVGPVGRQDNFFQLGGHSLLGVQAVVRMRQRFGCNLSVKVIFEHQTVAEFAAYIEAVLTMSTVAAGSGNVAGSQSRLRGTL